MFKVLGSMLSYDFMIRAIIVGSLVSLCSTLLGTSLVLKRYSMIGDGLSHVGFAALAIAYALQLAPMSVSIPICVIAAFFLLQLEENSKIKGDAATALLCSGALAVGVMTISLTTGMNTDVCNYMFGSILAISPSDMRLSVILSVVVLFLYIFFYPRIFAVTFDENFAKASGTNTRFYNMVLALLTSITIVLGMRMMGTLLISSLIVFPSITAMRVCKNFLGTIILASILSLFGFFVGMTLSFLYRIPTGASIVVIDIVLFFLFCAIEAMRNRKG
ncbi:metal ABC transporter permease [Oribacterium sinus]|jgi:metal cation ABC superfamily ATP binding cassette transporter, membrane protein|uniref:ABC 3 transport family protein n=1 Tax=Oribacterium sinus F0268 TaxID=585501 RepID=C2KVB8_9FIRM|nr:metal ABC transporter permease [Oribacterium sinus]EEJ52278.1 ABC 3 transport family protein [Oribacterium sinus F0268]